MSKFLTEFYYYEISRLVCQKLTFQFFPIFLFFFAGKVVSNKLFGQPKVDMVETAVNTANSNWHSEVPKSKRNNEYK